MTTEDKQREIKFRSLYEGKWYYQTLEEILTITLAAFRLGKHKTQYTGLKDKNIKDIYGDDLVLFNGRILKVDFGSYIEAWDGVCPKDGHNAIGWYMVDNDEKCIKSLLTSWSLPVMKQIEIIGNIHENKDLLQI